MRAWATLTTVSPAFYIPLAVIIKLCHNKSMLVINNPQRLPGVVKGKWIGVPRAPGVYFAFHGTTLLYVGSSMDMGRRLRCHNKTRGWPAGTMVRWHLCDAEEMASLELDCISRFKPTENRLGVAVIGNCHCNQCENDWKSRKANPTACPRCKRYDWAQPKKGS